MPRVRLGHHAVGRGHCHAGADPTRHDAKTARYRVPAGLQSGGGHGPVGQLVGPHNHRQLTSKKAICNRIAAEIAMQLAWAQIETFEHYRNTLNVEASRIAEGREVPQRLRRTPPDPFPAEPLEALAMKDCARTQGIKKEKKEKRKRRQGQEAFKKRNR